MISLKILVFFAIIIKQVNSMLLWLKHRRRQNLVRILETHSPIGSQPNSAQALSLLRFTLGEKPGYGWQYFDCPCHNLFLWVSKPRAVAESYPLFIREVESSRWRMLRYFCLLQNIEICITGMTRYAATISTTKPTKTNLGISPS